MAGDKYLDYDTTLGHAKRQTAVQSSAGVGSAGKIGALDANGKWDSTMMPTGFGDETASYPTSENLTAGNLVNVFDAGGGVMTARKADGSVTGKRCTGFVAASTVSPAAAIVFAEGFNNNATGLVGTGDVYLSQATPGLATSTIPTTAGGIAQRVGTAASATSFDFEADQPIAL